MEAPHRPQVPANDSQVATESAEPQEIQSVINELLHGKGDALDRAANAILRNPEPYLAALLAEFRQIVARIRETGRWVPEFEGFLPAFALLADLRPPEFLATFVDSLALPGDLTYELYDDVLSEVVPYVLAELVGDRTEIITNLVLNAELEEIKRWSLVTSFRAIARLGVLSREEACQRLMDLTRRAQAAGDHELVSKLPYELGLFGVAAALPLIEKLFRLGLADELLASLDDCRQYVAGDLATFENPNSRFWSLDGKTVWQYLQEWSAIDDTPADNSYDAADEPEFDDEEFEEEYAEDFDEDYIPPPALNETTVRYETFRVGRNDPCPCGSGRKFKKCCLGRGPDVHANTE